MRAGGGVGAVEVPAGTGGEERSDEEPDLCVRPHGPRYYLVNTIAPDQSPERAAEHLTARQARYEASLGGRAGG